MKPVHDTSDYGGDLLVTMLAWLPLLVLLGLSLLLRLLL